MAATTSPAVEYDTTSSQTVMVLTAMETGEAHAEAIQPLPVREIRVEPPSWECMVVAAGIDREAREFSEAETLMADFRAGCR